MTFDIVFWILAVIAVVSALAVVVLRNVFRAALAMMLCFFMIAGLYASLGADLLAVVQVLIYVGAISILIILAIMLTRDVWQASRPSAVGIPAVIAFLLFGAVLVFTLLKSQWNTGTLPAPEPTTAALGVALFGKGGFILPLEVSAALLLAAVIGAMLLIREK
ncbi:MAG: NADH-quinone oxidoreductase subunit J [Chloroflexota bacterium]